MHGVCCTVYLPDAAREKAHDAMRQVGRRGEEMSTLRAQSITWASENKARRAEVASLRRELDELKREHGAVVSSATMWEERSNKLQDELKLKAELATMWKRSAEKAGAGDMEERFCSAALDIIGRAVFDYDFESATAESPLVRAVYRCLVEAEHRTTAFIPY